MNKLASYIRLFLYTCFVFIVFEISSDSPNQWSFQKDPDVWYYISGLISLFILFEFLISALKKFHYNFLQGTAKEKLKQIELEDKMWYQNMFKSLSDAKPVEEEDEIILNHNYDGIQELDNNLPPWWIWMFYATIFFAVFYLIRFEIYNDYSQAEEYEQEVAQAEIDIAKYKLTAKDLIDFETVTLLTEESDLASGKKIFSEKCVACHKADAGGGIGPNLTDKHWILGGGINNVFKTVAEGGRSGKGMIPWKNDLKPSEIAQVSSYILSLQGTKPAEPKKAEGEIWIDENAEVKEVVLDSLSNKTDEVLKVIDSTSTKDIIEEVKTDIEEIKN